MALRAWRTWAMKFPNLRQNDAICNTMVIPQKVYSSACSETRKPISCFRELGMVCGVRKDSFTQVG